MRIRLRRHPRLTTTDPTTDCLSKRKGLPTGNPQVIQAGFEPTTHSLEGCCSIQLSYWTIF